MAVMLFLTVLAAASLTETFTALEQRFEAELLQASDADLDHTVEVARRAQLRGVPVVALAGSLGHGAPAVHDVGIGAIASIITVPMPLSEAVANGEKLLADAGFSVLGAEERAQQAAADDGAPAGGCCAGTDDAGPCGSGAAVASEAGAAEDARPDTGAEGAVKPELRRRGAGTAEPANA